MKKRTILALYLVASTPLLAVEPARIYVNTAANPGGDGSSWGMAFQDLQSALTAAQASPIDDEIWVAQGTYTADPGGTDRTKTFLLQNGVLICGGFTGVEVNLSERNQDPATNGTVLSGDLLSNDAADFTNYEDNSFNVVTGTGTDASAQLDGFTITGGNANRGGGLLCNGSGTPTIVRCNITHNKASSAGGGISLSSASATFTDCHISNNQAGSYGGGVEIAVASPVFDNCRIESNHSNFYGGGIFAYYSPTLFNRCSIRGNKATRNGGGCYINNGTPSFVSSEFIGNEAAYGGGVYSFNLAVPVLTNVTIHGNRGTSLGGGLYNGANAFVTNSIIWNNSSAGSKSTVDASVFNSSSSPSFSHCIIENSGGSSSWDLNIGTDLGSNMATDPLFASASDPANAPSLAGDTSLAVGSPAIDAGTGNADLDGSGPGSDLIISEPYDLAGNSRLSGAAIDIGSNETELSTGTPITFATLFQSMNPGEDENGNGRSNFLDYAMGNHPGLASDPASLPSINGDLLVVSHRAAAADVTPIYKKSSTLGSWAPMVADVDYTVESSQKIGERQQVTMKLLMDREANPKMFFVQEFAEP